MRFSVPALLLVLSSSLAAQQSYYLQNGNDWIRFDGEQVYRVDPFVVTVRTSGPIDVQHVLDGLEGPLAGAQRIRSNRLGFHDIRVPEGRDVMAFVRSLRAAGCFDLVEENTLGSYVGGIPGDPMFPSQWNLNNTGQSGGTPGADVSALDAWDIQDGDPSIVVAVIDSGTDWFHEDLAGNIWANTDEMENGADSDGNGYVDDIRGWDFEFDNNDPSSGFWHGTSVASVVSSQGNGVGLVGLAGGANDGAGVSIMPLGAGTFFPISSVLDDAILYALDNGAHIVTLSLSVGQSAAIDAAVADAHAGGVFLDCAAGNNGSSVTYPATLSEIVAVASTNHNDVRSSFSNPGPEVEVAAPGENVWMAFQGNGYHISSGTSFASPHVAGLAGLLLSQDPTLTNEEIRTIIADSADDVDAPGIDNNTGSGRINASEALLMVATPGSLEYYGTGTVGGNGSPPGIVASAVPTIGATFDISTNRAAPNAPAVLILGMQSASIPFLGGIINVDPTNLLAFATTTTGTGDGSLTFTIPNNPNFIEAERFAQWLVLDAGAPGGLAMSQGLHITVGE